MSKFGVEKFAEKDMEALYAPHGIDTDVYRPYSQAECREGMGLPADAFVIGMVANNQGNSPPRKAFPQVMEAFKIFQARHDDAFLYMHSRPNVPSDGLNLPFMAKHMGLPENVMGFTPEFAMQVGIEQDRMAMMYSSFDVLACPSYGEGFGIPIVEAQSCGVPVVVNNWTAMPELVGDGWVCDGEPWWNMSQGSYFKAPTVSSILDCFEQAYKQRGGGSVKAREFALDYDARKVYQEHWVPILADLEGRSAEKGLPQVKANRAARRRKKAA
jgi:glycosyltransferase involved in cell wall biosynthesis